MKKSIIVCFLASIGLFSCRKDDNPKLPDLAQVAVPKITLDATSDKFINAGNPALFKGVFIVDLHFKEDKPQKFDIVVRKKRGTSSVIKVVQANIASFPSTVSITGQQMIDLFGEDIEGGDIFDFGADVYTLSGQKFDAFPQGAASYGSGVANLPGSSTSVSFIAPCGFSADNYAGDFEVVSDEWGDYAAGVVIPVKKVSETQISFEYNVDPGSAKPIILTVNPADNTVSVEKQLYGSYGAFGITEIYAEGVPGPASAVNPCNQTVSVKLSHVDQDGGAYGDYTIVLKKK